MRIIIFIKKDKIPLLWKHIHARALHLDVCSKVILGKAGLTATKTIIATIIQDVLGDCKKADQELNLAPESEEEKEREYLTSLICQ